MRAYLAATNALKGYLYEPLFGNEGGYALLFSGYNLADYAISERRP